MFVRRVWPSRPTFESAYADADYQLRNDMLRLLGALSNEAAPNSAAGVFPPVNVTQDNDRFYVRAEIPGIDPKQLSISAIRNRLLISGVREIPKEQERVSYHRKERAEGTFDRSVTLPAEVDADRVDARYNDGILTVTLPKAEAAKPRQIKVNG
jgi:HSP20 family protein